MKLRLLFSALFILTVFGARGEPKATADAKPAREPQASPPKDRTQTTILSDFSDFDYRTKKGIFEGNVRVEDPDLKLKSEKMIVFLDEKDNSVTKVQAFTKVEIRRKGETAYCDQAVFNKATGIILLTGKPKEQPYFVDAKGNTVYGDEIIIEPNADHMRAQGNTKSIYYQKSGGGSIFAPQPGATGTNDTTRPKN
jgi:lipopolysaccharide transport protein LptA